MAVYKPTDCSPFNGTFDVAQDLPIFFECKIDTSNAQITAYTIEIYDSNNNLIFPQNNDEPLINRVSFIDELATYVRTYYPERNFNTANINSGLNGSYLEIPVIVKNKANNTVARNQVLSQDIANGQQYYWRITLYQQMPKTGLPTNINYYDMTMAHGTILGSTFERLQTPLIYNDEYVVKGLSLINKYVQLGNSNIHNINLDSPIIDYAYSTFQQVGNRALISNYNSTYGYIYPSIVEGASFSKGQVSRDSCDSFKIFKQGNNPALLGATDMAYFVYNGAINEGTSVGASDSTWKWVDNLSDVTTSYWQETYNVIGEPSGTYYPLGNDYPLYGNERIVFNNVRKDAAIAGTGTYYGSPYNGVYYPTFSSVKKEGEGAGGEIFTVTVRWNRVPDMASWGNLITKVLYVQSGSYAGQNIELTVRSTYGQINKTPFKFQAETPVRLFNTVQAITTALSVPAGQQGAQVVLNLSQAISEILSVKIAGGNLVSASNYSFAQNSRFIVYTKQSASAETLMVEYIPYSSRDYQGVIFYNATGDANYYTTPNDVVFIRPSVNINSSMALKWDNSWISIAAYGSKYAYVERGSGSSIATMESDATRYSIASFYQTSDFNPFTLYATPTLSYVVTVNNQSVSPDNNTGAYVINARNFTIQASYEQSNFIQWQSFQWTLWNQDKSVLLDKGTEIYGGDIIAEFRGLENKTTYIVTLSIQNNAGKVIVQNIIVQTDFEESGTFSGNVQLTLDCDNAAAKATMELPDAGLLVVAPDADSYSDQIPEELEANKRAYVWNADTSSNFFYVGNEQSQPQATASVSNGELILKTPNALSFSKIFKQHNISDNTAVAPIEVSGRFVIENDFTFTAPFSGEFFSIAQDNDSLKRGFTIPAFFDGTNNTISSDAYKIQYKNSSDETKFLTIVDENGNEGLTWDTLYLISNWVPSNSVEPIDFGSLANVADFDKAQVVDEYGEITEEYYNIQGYYNSYDETYPVWDEKREDETSPKPRALWMDMKPADKQKQVIIKADRASSPNYKTTSKSVCTKELPRWNDDAAGCYNSWDDGPDETLLTFQKQVSPIFNGDTAIVNHKFCFRIYVDADTMTILDNSRCYLQPIVIPKLDTPEGVSIQGKDAFWNPVANATQYKIFLGSTMIGSTEGTSTGAEV